LEELDKLEEKIRRLKREYDLFLAGQRRGEPVKLRTEVEREVLRLSRYPFHSTALRFRMGGLAHRFRALETQLRAILEQRDGRKKEQQPPASGEAAAVVVDRLAIETPASIERHLRSLHRALVETLDGRAAPSLESLRTRLLEQARVLMARPGVHAIRFSLADGESGPKIRGEILHEGPGSPGE